MKKLIKIGLLIISIGLLYSGFNNYRRLSDARKTIEEARVHTESLAKEQKKLEDELSKTENNQFVEKQLRDKLGFAKEGEIVIVLPPQEELKKLAPPKISEEEYVPKKNWEKWMELFL